MPYMVHVGPHCRAYYSNCAVIGHFTCQMAYVTGSSGMSYCNQTLFLSRRVGSGHETIPKPYPQQLLTSHLTFQYIAVCREPIVLCNISSKNPGPQSIQHSLHVCMFACSLKPTLHSKGLEGGPGGRSVMIQLFLILLQHRSPYYQQLRLGELYILMPLLEWKGLGEGRGGGGEGEGRGRS